MSRKTFNSRMGDILIPDPTDIQIIAKNDASKEIYDRFNKDFELYLNKLPNNPVKRYVSEVFNRDLVCIGYGNLNKDVNIQFARVDFTNDRLNRILLDAREMGINTITGESRSIDECIYATYFAFLRFTVVANRGNIKRDRKLQILLAQYFYQIMISVLDTSNVNTSNQKFFIKLISYYAFFRHFFLETYASTVRLLRDIFKTESDMYTSFLPKLKEIDKYTTVKDFPKMLIDTDVLVLDPNVFSINLLRKYKQNAFYCILGSLDMFTAFTVITKYPFDMFSNVPIINNSIQREVEDILVTYMRRVRFN